MVMVRALRNYNLPQNPAWVNAHWKPCRARVGLLQGQEWVQKAITESG